MGSKEKEIEEMVKTIFLYVDSKGKKNVYIVGSEFADDLKTYSHNYGVAEALYNAGYRKTFTSELASDLQKVYKSGYLKGLENMGIRYGQLNEALRRNIQLEETIDNKDKLIDKLLNENIERVKEVSKLKTYNNKLSKGIYFGNGKQFSVAIEEEREEGIRGFAELLQKYAKECKESGYDGIGEQDIEDKLKEFLNENY